MDDLQAMRTAYSKLADKLTYAQAELRLAQLVGRQRMRVEEKLKAELLALGFDPQALNILIASALDDVREEMKEEAAKEEYHR